MHTSIIKHITKPNEIDLVISQRSIPTPSPRNDGDEFSVENVKYFLKGGDFAPIQSFFKDTPVSEDAMDEYNIAQNLFYNNELIPLLTTQQKEKAAYVRSMMYFLGTKADPEGDPFINIIPAYIDVAQLDSNEDKELLIQGLLNMMNATHELYNRISPEDSTL